MKQYSTDMLKPGDTFVVKGYTSYPRLTHVIDGPELKEEIERATRQNRVPQSSPHTYTTLIDAEVEYANPQAPTAAECYAAERLYTNKDGKICYSAIRKSSTLADYGVVDPNNPSVVNGIYLDPNKLLANGLLVKCYFRVFKTKAGLHNGVSLDSIVFQEPVQYYESSNTASDLQARGIVYNQPTGEPPVYNPAPVQMDQAPAPAYGAPAYGAPVPQQTEYQQAPTAAAAPAPVPPVPQPFVPNMQTPPAQPQPVPAYQQTPFPTPAAQPAPSAPVPAPTPVPAVAPQPNMPPMNPPVGNPAAAVPAPAPVPPVPQQAAPTQPPQQSIGNTGESAFDNAYRY